MSSKKKKEADLSDLSEINRENIAAPAISINQKNPFPLLLYDKITRKSVSSKIHRIHVI